jgi:uncharacterized protein with WD repeat
MLKLSGNGNQCKPLDVGSGAQVYACFQKSFQKAEWPYLQFSADDSIACRVVTNEVHFIRSADFSAQHLRQGLTLAHFKAQLEDLRDTSLTL